LELYFVVECDFVSPADQTTTSSVFLEAVSRKLGQQATATWFKSLNITVSPKTRLLSIAAPNAVIRDWILNNYSGVLAECLRGLALDDYRIEWHLCSSAPADTAENILNISGSRPGNRANDDLQPELESTEKASHVRSLRAVLNTGYTFESFVVGSCNRFAHAAAKAVADSPGKTYNPLYIYGPVGLGKTHLIQAVGQAIVQRGPTLLVAYVSLERFMNELINAIRYGYDKTQAFRDRYRTIDVLLIDDIQFIAGKERTQEEFFHTFNALYERQKQIVLTSDCSPRAIPEIEERLHSRFEWGLIADLELPDLETKVAILKRKADGQGIDLPDDVALFLASASKHNIRELEGSLVRLLAMASMRGVPVTITLAEEALGKISRRYQHNGLSIRRVQDVVAAHYKLKVDNLISRSNVRRILLPRQLAMYLCKQLIGSSYPEIGREFGGKHHTTVIHSVEKIDRLQSVDADLRNTLNGLTDTLKNSTS
jgi:chromosomal replication initiator protein